MDQEELEAYAASRKKEMFEAYDFLTAEGQTVRAEILEENFPNLDCSGVALYEHKKIFTDDYLLRYQDATDDELREVLERAKEYDGPWYHSYVTFTEGGDKSPLASEIEALPPSAGVYVSHFYDSEKAD